MAEPLDLILAPPFNTDPYPFYHNIAVCLVRDIREGVVEYAAAGIWGTVFAVASVSVHSIEFLLCNDGPGHPFCYLITPLDCTTLPEQLASAHQLMRPYLYGTYWPENNVRPAPAGNGGAYTHTRMVSSRVGAAESLPSGLVGNGDTRASLLIGGEHPCSPASTRRTASPSSTRRTASPSSTRRTASLSSREVMIDTENTMAEHDDCCNSLSAGAERRRTPTSRYFPASPQAHVQKLHYIPITPGVRGQNDEHEHEHDGSGGAVHCVERTR
ncbi:hypothetical protein C8T65DRAFT_745737 [Cerioporus squamosus]|nr:hypothetical protein C8T65DRAFT_745737 [Cerioporus squamosus]